MAMGSLNYGLFIKPMGDELGIGRSTFGLAQTARQFSSAGTSPIVGWLLDRFGVRVLLPVAAIITGCAMIGLSFTSQGWHLVVLFSLMGLVGMSGPGALVTSIPVLKWFVRNRGKALSFMALGIPAGAVIFVPLTQAFIDAWGWRTTWFVLAIIAMAIIVPLSAILVRRQPEDIGLLPDGAEPDDGPDSPALLNADFSWTSRSAIKTRALWQLVVVFSVLHLGVGIVGVHRIPAFMDRGMDPTLISFATAVDAICAGAATFAFGMLVRRISVRALGATGFLLLAAASVLTIYAYQVPMMALSMAVFGLGIGGMIFLQNYIWADYFGREHIGSIRGLVMPINLVVGGIGAPLAGYARDATGSYDTVWWVGVGLMVFAAIVLVFTGRPARPSSNPAISVPA